MNFNCILGTVLLPARFACISLVKYMKNAKDKIVLVHQQGVISWRLCSMVWKTGQVVILKNHPKLSRTDEKSLKVMSLRNKKIENI